MLFYQPTKRLEIPKIEINNEKNECVEHFDFLGLILHKHLIWKSHVTKVANKISKTIGIIIKLKYQLPQTTLQTICNSLLIIVYWHGDTTLSVSTNCKKRLFE